MAELHLAGFFENQDGAAILQPLARLADALTAFHPQGQDADHIRVSPEARFIAGAYAAVDATVQPRARIVADSFRKALGRTAIEVPLLSGTVEPGSPPLWNDWRSRPIELKSGEELSVETLNNPASAADQYCLMWFSDGPVTPIDATGGYWARHTTAASALTANAWGNRALVQEQVLEPGRYDVLGMRPVSTSLIAARLAFTRKANRPGVLGADARADIPHPAMQPGQLGVLGSFDTDALPTVDLLANAADNEVQVIDLFIRPTRGR